MEQTIARPDRMAAIRYREQPGMERPMGAKPVSLHFALEGPCSGDPVATSFEMACNHDEG